MRDKLAFFDVESFPNFFMISFRMRTPDGSRDEIFKVGDWESGRDYFSNNEYWYVGFNSASYDDIMIAYWLCLGVDATDELLYDMNQYLIEDDHVAQVETLAFIEANISEFSFHKFGQLRTNRSLVPNSDAWKMFGGWNRKAIDLYMLGEKQGSLKNAATVLGVDSLMESPIEFGTVLDEAGKADIVKYCWSDIETTEKAYDYYEKIMQVRDEFSKKYGIHNAHNIGSAKLAEKYLLNMHKSKLGDIDFSSWQVNVDAYLDTVSETKTGDLVSRLTKDYKHEFRDSGMSRLWSMIKRSYLSYKTTVDADVDVWVDESVNFESWRRDAKKPSAYYIDGKAIPKGSLLFADDRGNEYKFGIGGLHSDSTPKYYESNDTHVVYVSDVTSYYPSLIASNAYSPETFPEFSEYIEQLLLDRKIAKAKGDITESNAKKLVLNSSFGKTKDRHSKLYDPLTHFSVTVNGQLLLLKLIDMIHEATEGKLIQCNTDGVAFYIPRSDIDKVRSACSEWEQFARVGLEEELYDVWAEKTCNNYVARRDDGVVKSKGSEFKLKPSSLKEVFSKSTAVKKAVVGFLLEGNNIDETLDGLPTTDFMMTMNFGKKTQLVVADAIVRKKVLRYCYSEHGVDFKKHTPSLDRYSIVGKGRKLKMVDVLSEIDKTEINVGAYSRDAKEFLMTMLMERTTKCLPKKVRDNVDECFEEWSREWKSGKQ